MLDYKALRNMSHEDRWRAIDEDFRRREPPAVRALFECLHWLAQRPGFDGPDEFWRRLKEPRPRPETTGLPQPRGGNGGAQ